MTVTFHIHTNNESELLLLQSSQALGVADVSDFGHGCMVVSCCFNLHFYDINMEHLFICLTANHVSSLEVSVQIVCPFLNQVVFLFLRVLCVFWITVHYQMSSTSTFFQSMLVFSFS